MKSVRFHLVCSPSPRQVERIERPMAWGEQPNPSWAYLIWTGGNKRSDSSLRIKITPFLFVDVPQT